MVLKIFISLLLIFISSINYANTVNNDALKLYKSGKFNEALLFLNSNSNQNVKNEDTMLLYVLLYNALKQNENANKSANQFIQTFYKAKHTQLLHEWKKGGIDDDQVSKKLLHAYYIAAQSIINMHSNYETYDMVHFYLDVCHYNEFKLEQIYQLQLLLTKIQEEKIKAKYHWNFAISLQYITWQDQIVLTENATGIKSKAFATNSGQCLGAQLSYQNGYYGYNLDSCFIKSTVYLKSQSNFNVDYSHKQENLNGLYLTAGIFLKPFTEKNRIGLNTFALNIQDYIFPNGYTGSQKILNYGISLNSNTYFTSSIYITTQFAALENTNLFSLGLGYEF